MVERISIYLKLCYFCNLISYVSNWCVAHESLLTTVCFSVWNTESGTLGLYTNLFCHGLDMNHSVALQCHSVPDAVATCTNRE